MKFPDSNEQDVMEALRVGFGDGYRQALHDYPALLKGLADIKAGRTSTLADVRKRLGGEG